MSRVDEARRRAAELASQGTVSRVDVLRPLPLSDTARLTIDAFPLEPRTFPSDDGHVEPCAAPRTPSGGVRIDEARDVNVEEPNPASSPRPDRQATDALPHKFIGATGMSQASEEQYHLLAAALHNMQLAKSLKVIMVVSAVAGEGKTLTAANLALTFSESYQRRVLLVDADLRHPMLQDVFTQADATFSDAAARRRQLPAGATALTSRLALQTVAVPTSAPLADLTSERMDDLLRQAREGFDWVVIDTPPVALLPDASLLASKVDGAILVVKAESTPLELVQRAVAAIGRPKMLGFVLNAARISPITSGRYEPVQRLGPLGLAIQP
jgi:capsular exopolysaccharide synthesis family protein